MDHCEEVGGEPVVAGSDAAEVLQLREEALDLDRAATHFSNTGVDPDNFVNTRRFDDMAPFHFQIEAASHHSVWGVEAHKTGAFTRSRGVSLGKRDYEGRLTPRPPAFYEFTA